MSKSWLECSISYARERYPFKVFLPIACGLAFAALASNWFRAIPGTPESFNFPISVITALTMMFQFRLWDDVADHPYDRIHHPKRVLSSANTLKPFALNVVLAGIVNAGLLAFSGAGFAGFVLLNLGAALWYFAVRINWRRSIGGRHLLLLKYPAFVFLITPAGNRLPLVIPSLAVVYLCSAIYELFHDGETRSKPAAQALILMEVCLLGFVLMYSQRET